MQNEVPRPTAVRDILAMLDFFYDHVPDTVSNRSTRNVCADPRAWSAARDVFRRIRDRCLRAIEDGNRQAEAQYCFEEVCVQTVWNLMEPAAPFDADAPYWVIKNALALAKCLGLSPGAIVEIVSEDRASSTT